MTSREEVLASWRRKILKHKIIRLKQFLGDDFRDRIVLARALVRWSTIDFEGDLRYFLDNNWLFFVRRGTSVGAAFVAAGLVQNPQNLVALRDAGALRINGLVYSGALTDNIPIPVGGALILSRELPDESEPFIAVRVRNEHPTRGLFQFDA